MIHTLTCSQLSPSGVSLTYEPQAVSLAGARSLVRRLSPLGADVFQLVNGVALAGSDPRASYSVGVLDVDLRDTTWTPQSAWPLDALDRVCDHVGAPLGLASTVVTGPLPSSDDTSAKRQLGNSLLAGRPAGHGLLALGVGPSPAFPASLTMGWEYRYASHGLIAAIYRAAGVSRPNGGIVYLDCLTSPGVVLVDGWRSLPSRPGDYDEYLYERGLAASFAGITPVTDAVGPLFEGALCTGVRMVAPAGLWGWIGTQDTANTLLFKQTSHELANAMITRAAGRDDRIRDLALELLRQDAFILDVTLASADGALCDLDQWPEAVSAGMNAAQLADLQYGRSSGREVRRAVLASGRVNVRVAVPDVSGRSGATVTVDIDAANQARTLNGELLTSGQLSAGLMRRSIVVRYVAPTLVRADAIAAVEARFGVAALDGAESALAPDWTTHTGLGSEHTIWAAHACLPRSTRELGILSAFYALEGRHSIVDPRA